MKVFVIDTPNNCYECRCSNEGCYLCQISRRQLEDDFLERRPSWCPLKDLPHSKQLENRWFSDDYSKGWNDCLKELDK